MKCNLRLVIIIKAILLTAGSMYLSLSNVGQEPNLVLINLKRLRLTDALIFLAIAALGFIVAVIPFGKWSYTQRLSVTIR